MHFSGRGTIKEFPIFLGTPKKIADEMEEWFGSACDGFVISATHIPGFLRGFRPHWWCRNCSAAGLFQKEYKGNTLRENLGMKKPEIGAWRRPAQAA